MRQITLILAICVVGAVSCCPSKHLSTSQRDSVRVVTSIQTIERLVRDTVHIAVPEQSERQTIRDTVSRLDNDFAASCARINTDGSLYHDLRTKPGKWTATIDRHDTQTIRTDSVSIDRARQEIIRVPREFTGWQRMQMRGFWVLLAVVIFLCQRPILRLIKQFI